MLLTGTTVLKQQVWLWNNPAVGASDRMARRNHVAYVEAVHGDGTITISEMGVGWQQGYAVRVISTDGAVFIY